MLADLVKYLPRLGVDLEAVVAGPASAPPSDEVLISSFGDASAGTRARCLGARRAVCARVDSGAFDLVASHFALYAAAAVDRLRRLPHVVHFYGPWAAESRQEGGGALAGLAKWSLERMVYATADRVIVMSEAFAALAERDYGISREQQRVVPGAVDLQRFRVRYSRQEARAAQQWPADRPTLLAVRRLVQRTGVDRLIEAMPRVKAAIPDVLLMVGGTGRLRGRLEERMRALKLEDHVRFLGYVPDEQLPLAYRAADINVLPTIALEGFGLSAVESLATGTPSMVTPVGALPEVVSPLSPALVFPSTSPADIADGLVAALNGSIPLPGDDECQAFAVQHFSAELMASRVAAVYEEVC